MVCGVRWRALACVGVVHVELERASGLTPDPSRGARPVGVSVRGRDLEVNDTHVDEGQNRLAPSRLVDGEVAGGGPPVDCVCEPCDQTV